MDLLLHTFTADLNNFKATVGFFMALTLSTGFLAALLYWNLIFKHKDH